MPFTERDIRNDREALEELVRIGARSTPVIVVDGQSVIGFDEHRLGELLKSQPSAG